MHAHAARLMWHRWLCESGGCARTGLHWPTGVRWARGSAPRNSRCCSLADICTWPLWEMRPGLQQSACRRCVCFAFVCKPGRSLCQDVALLFNLPQFAAWGCLLLALGGGQWCPTSPAASILLWSAQVPMLLAWQPNSLSR